jgi:ATP-dependent Clp protease ATP-binding subunit ClpB
MLKKTLKPEFLNRIDEVVMFQPLSKREIKDIINLQLNKLRELLAQRNLNIEFSDYAMKLLADLGYDPMFGARPLKRVIQKLILNELSKLLLSDEIAPGDTIMVDSLDEGKFVFYKKK